MHLPLPPRVFPRRVVVTGLGLVTPLGIGVASAWPSLLRGECGVRPWPEGGAGAVAARVPRGPAAHEWDSARHVPRAEARTMSPDFIAYALAAAGEALGDAGLLPPATVAALRDGGGCGAAANGCALSPVDGRVGPYAPELVGVSLGSGIGALEEIGEAAVTLSSGGSKKLSPFFVPRILLNSAAGSAAARFGLRGPSTAPATACASGAHAIADAFRLVACGASDVMLAGGTEAALGRLSHAGFSRARALATYEDDGSGGGEGEGRAARACSRPFDSLRSGFVMGEGAGVLVLETLEGALARRAPVIYGELRGVGLSSDAFHATQPRPDGSGAAACMRSALREGGLNASEVGYVNAHATGTPMGDGVEALGIARTWGWREGGGAARGSPHTVAVSSTKGSIGHLLGAAGSVEAVFSLLTLHSGFLPHGINLDTLDDATARLSCAHSEGGVIEFLGLGGAAPRERGRVRAVMSNSFGFGGTNVSLLFGEIER